MSGRRRAIEADTSIGFIDSYLLGNASSIRVWLRDLFIEDGHGLYYLAFALYSVWSWLNRTTIWSIESMPAISIVENMIQLSILALLAISFLKQRATRGEWVLALLTLCLGFTVWLISDEGWFFWIIIFVVCGKGARLLPLAVISLMSVLAVTVLSFGLSSFGVIEDKIIVRESSEEARHSMGFEHPNSFGAALLVITISLTVVCWHKKTAVLVVVALAASYLSAIVADSRTTSLCLVAMAVILPVIKLAEKKKGGLQACASLLLGLVVLMVVVSIFLGVFYDPSRSVDVFLDRLFSGRIRLANAYYENGGLTLFGYNYPAGPMYWTGIEECNFVVDNLYAHILLRYGLVAFILFVIAVVLLLVKMIRCGSSGALLFGIGMFLIYGLSETFGFRVECDFFIIALWTVLYRCPVNQFDDRANYVGVQEGVPSNREELSLWDCIKSVCRFRGFSND